MVRITAPHADTAETATVRDCENQGVMLCFPSMRSNSLGCMPRPAHRWRDVPRSASRRQHWRLWRRLRRQATTDDGRAGNEGTGRCQWQQRTRHACAATAGEWAARVYFALWLGSCGSRPAGVSLGRLDTRSRFTLLLQRCYVRRRVITRPAPRRSLTSLCTKAEQQCRSSPSPPRGVAVEVDGWSRGKG